MLTSAAARAARGGFVSNRVVKISCSVTIGHRDRVLCQKNAAELLAKVLGKSRTPATSESCWSEPGAGGGPGRTWLPDSSTHVRQLPKVGNAGTVPSGYPSRFHKFGSVGSVP